MPLYGQWPRDFSKFQIKRYIYIVSKINLTIMANISITKMSSKGQIVIPQELRVGIKEGEEFIIIRDGSRIVLKNIKDFDENIKEDLEFAKKTEEAWEEIEAGKGTSMEFDDFIKEMKKW